MMMVFVRCMDGLSSVGSGFRSRDSGFNRHARRTEPRIPNPACHAVTTLRIRSTAQSLLDYVPHGATTEGYGGTYATQENFRIMREALDEESRRLGRYLQLTNYSSGLCMPEIAFAAAWERLDMLLNDAMYGILFRDINMKRTLCDQVFSRRICALAEITINTGEDNYITTADADEAAHTVIASQFVNQSFARRAGLADRLLGLGHSFEIDPSREDTIAREIAQALLVRTLFPESPTKYMPPTKHKQGDIFFSHAYDVMADVVGQLTGQSIQLLGMMTEAMHNPFLMDRYVALKSAAYVHRAWRSMGGEVLLRPGGAVERRAQETLGRARRLLGWEPKVRFKQLVKLMVEAELERVK